MWFIYGRLFKERIVEKTETLSVSQLPLPSTCAFVLKNTVWNHFHLNYSETSKNRWTSIEVRSKSSYLELFSCIFAWSKLRTKWKYV